MQFLQINKLTTIDTLASFVGPTNVEYVLHLNDMPRCPNIGEEFIKVCKERIASIDYNIPWQRKQTILNSFTPDSDIFEMACLLSEQGWKLLSEYGTFPNFMRIPDSIEITPSAEVLGNETQVHAEIYNRVVEQLATEPHIIDPAVFNEYSTIDTRRLITSSDYFSTNYSTGMSGDMGLGFNKRTTVSPSFEKSTLYQYFQIPWGDVSLFSSISGESIDFPVYPESVSDSAKSNYTQMPDLLYQYEPWQIYTGSGPRQNQYTFDFHRDMWTGDHRDGAANNLIRFCESNCYPEYNGSSVNAPYVTLYVKGNSLISGVMNEVSTEWDGPIGLDGWYLHCKLTLTITEVSQVPLNYSVVRNKSLIG